MKVGMNGKLVEAGEAVISVYDHGFLYGLGLFETFRTYGGRPYLLDRHMSRLQEGCAELGIRFTMSEQEIGEWTSRLLRENGLQDGYVRLTVSAGEDALGLPLGDYEQPTVVLLAKELPPTNDEALMSGRELRLLQTKRNTPEGTVRFKSLHYMNNILAKRELLGLMAGAGGAASASGATSGGTEGLMLTQEGWLAEGIVSNLFFVRNNIVCTPSVDTGILPGVTRQRVLELATEAGYMCETGLYRWGEIMQAQEIWMTNSIQELIPITTLTGSSERVQISEGTAGPITRELLKRYRADAKRLG